MRIKINKLLHIILKTYRFKNIFNFVHFLTEFLHPFLINIIYYKSQVTNYIFYPLNHNTIFKETLIL